MRIFANIVILIATVVALASWVAFVVQFGRLRWHIRADIDQPTQLNLFLAPLHPEWLTPDGLKVRRSVLSIGAVAAVAVAVVFVGTLVQGHVDA